MTKIDKVKQGKQNRVSGLKFELKVRKDLEEKGWIVSKWNNNIDLENNKIIPAKHKFNPFKKVMTLGTGFPDFIAFTKPNQYLMSYEDFYTIKYIGEDIENKGYSEVIGVEAKSDGRLNKIEKEKCVWYLKNHIFSKILIASKSKERGKIDYKKFKIKELRGKLK
ncbi:MAG TPA: hypothetical protein ENI61_06205 [Ignavibacteria bacterium]|nr:hypothetical protein [Ignavibacteria bacterium]